MTSARSRFRFHYRHFKDTLVLLPGWATDYRIFSTLELNYNYLLPLRFALFNFKEQLLAQLDQRSLRKIYLFGWSLGGFLACDFASCYPDRVEGLFLLSIRRSYSPKLIEKIEIGLKKNKRAYLYKFYLNCFSPQDHKELGWFRKHLLRKYLKEFKLEDLLFGLDYLSGVQIDSWALGRIKKITVFHGKEDKIAPLSEINQIRSLLPQAKFVLMPGVGHSLFLNQNFKERFIEVSEKL